jgi:hypothetical protein
MPETLDAIGLRHGTDKASNGQDVLFFYERFLEPMRGRAIRLLEIGVLNGSSLRMWSDYFPDGTIIGVDRDRGALAHVGSRISIELADQSSKPDLDRIASLGPFDIILDDGSHVWKHQILSLQTLFPSLRLGGFYIVEDLVTSYGRYRPFYASGRLSTADYLHKLSDWVVGHREMLKENDQSLMRLWPLIDLMVFHQNAALLQRRLVSRQFNPAKKEKRSGLVFQLARMALRR